MGTLKGILKPVPNDVFGDKPLGVSGLGISFLAVFEHDGHQDHHKDLQEWYDMYTLVCKIYTLFCWHAVLRRPRVITRAPGCEASKAPIGTLRRMLASRPGSVAVL